MSTMMIVTSESALKKKIKKKIKEKKRKSRSDFGFPCAKPYLTPLLTTPFFQFSLISLIGSFLLIYFFFFFFISPSGSFSSLLQTLFPAPPYHHFHHHFSGKIIGKFLGTHKHLHILFFEVKISHLLGGFYTFA